VKLKSFMECTFFGKKNTYFYEESGYPSDQRSFKRGVSRKRGGGSSRKKRGKAWVRVGDSFNAPRALCRVRENGLVSHGRREGSAMRGERAPPSSPGRNAFESSSQTRGGPPRGKKKERKEERTNANRN